MEWFQGEAHEAISASKSFGTLLLVLVHDDPSTDPSSAVVLEALDSPEISARTSLQSTPSFYNLKLKKDSASYNQFAEVYPVFVVPSIYIIDGLTGKNLDIVGGLNQTKSQIIANLSKSLGVAQGEEQTTQAATVVLNDHQIPSPSSSVSAQPSEQVVTTENLVQGASNDQEFVQPMDVDPERAELNARVEKVRRGLAERRARLEAEESKKKEQERREVGKALNEHKCRKDELEMKEAMEERAKDKENDRMALERVRAQIAQDRAEKAARFATLKKEADEEREEKNRLELQKKAQEAEKLAAQRSTIARIQFRYPDGHHTSTTFDAATSLQALFDFVDADPGNIFGPNNFTLSASFPSRQLDQESRTVDLKQLGLAPSATVMVFPTGRSNGGGFPLVSGNLRSFIALLLTPLTVIWGFVMSFFGSNHPPTNRDGARAAEKRQAESTGQESQRKRPNTAHQRRNFRREGNVARLGDESDSDERNTYNGNSTQQM